MSTKICLLLPLFSAFLVSAAPATLPQSDAAPLITRIEAAQTGGKGEFDKLTLPALMQQLHVPGLSIAVVKDFKIHWAKAYGVADAKTGRLVDSNTRFQAASISKPVTAMAAMRMVEAGQLDLDKDINRFLTSWQVPVSKLTRQQPVTARSLFSHTSGADDGFGFPGYAPQEALPTVVQILNGQAPSNVGKVLFARAPYTEYKYSGGGTMIMQQAMMDLCRCAFDKLMQTTVLTPLQMSNSAFEYMPAAQSAALAHDEHGNGMQAPWHVYPEQAAAALWTTPTDLAKFIVEIQTALHAEKGQLLSRQAATDMTTPVRVGQFAVGLKVEQRGAEQYFSHSGANWGYRAWMTGHISKGYGMIIMTNSDNGMVLMNQVADRITKAYGWDAESAK
ncbi:MAG: serine hydrolase domain-containing protein [Chromatiaceae bacterium]|jgi:CubicO group peptidase (beta-lactamase class C family)